MHKSKHALALAPKWHRIISPPLSPPTTIDTLPKKQKQRCSKGRRRGWAEEGRSTGRELVQFVPLVLCFCISLPSSSVRHHPPPSLPLPLTFRFSTSYCFCSRLHLVPSIALLVLLPFWPPPPSSSSSFLHQSPFLLPSPQKVPPRPLPAAFPPRPLTNGPRI